MAAVSLCFLLFAAFQSVVSGQQTRTGDLDMQCSITDIKLLQRQWNWLTRHTTTAEKIALYNAVLEFYAKRHPTIGQKMVNEYFPELIPLEVRAYRMFADNDMFISAYSSPDVYISHVEHMILKQPTMMKLSMDNMKLMMDASANVLGSLIDSREARVSWTSCMENMMTVVRTIFERFLFRARCDVTASSDSNVEGHVNFTQPAAGGPTTVHVELSGFAQQNNKQLSANIHAGGCSESTAAEQRLGKVEVDQVGRAHSTFHNKQMSLFGADNIIGKSLLIDTGERSLCCSVYQTYTE